MAVFTGITGNTGSRARPGIVIDRKVREIMYLVAPVRPSVRLSVDTIMAEPFCLCVYNQSASADNRADAVDRLLIPYHFLLLPPLQ